MTDGMEFLFKATIEGLSEASVKLGSALEASGCPENIRKKLMIAIDEIGSNIVHYSGSDEFAVEIDFPENPEAIRISFSDAGKAFNPLVEAPAADISAGVAERRIGGLGMFMVKKMMDNISYVNENGRNVLTISKLRDAEK